MVTIVMDMVRGFWAVLAEMSPWLVLGFGLAGVLWVYVKPAWVARHLSAEDGRGKWAVVKASLMGVPLPLCSCGVIPVGTSLHRQGASKGASASFLISTPQTGVDSIFATYALMGPVFAVVRPAVALVSGVLGGWLVDFDENREKGEKAEKRENQKLRDGGGCGAASSCCDSASGSTTGGTPVPPGVWGKLKAAAKYGFVTLPADLVGSLFVGLLLAAVLTSLLSGDALDAWFGGAWGVVFAVLIGIPIYVCSTGSIPIAVALMAVGASPGAALAFLVAGPATNAATISVVGAALGKRTTAAYVTAVLVTAIASGYGLNAAVAGWGLDLRLPADAMHLHEHGLSWVDHAWAAALLALMVVGWGTRRGWWAPRPRPRKDGLGALKEDQAMSSEERVELPVEGMTCSHCAGSVEGALRAVPGVAGVAVDLPGKRAVVSGAGLEREILEAAVRGAGFRIADARG